MYQWIAVECVAGLAAASLMLSATRRLPGPAHSRRAMGVVALGAALILLLNLPAVRALVGAAVPTLELPLMHSLLVTLTVAALLAAAHRVQAPRRLVISPVGGLLVVAVLQIALSADESSTGPAGSQGTWLVTVMWAVTGCLHLLVPSWRLVPATRGSARVQTWLIIASSGVLAAGATWYTAQVVDAAYRGEHSPALAGGPQLAMVAGAALFAGSLAVADLTAVGRPFWMWIRACLALYRLERLAAVLVEAAPQWRKGLPPPWSWSDVRYPQHRLYQVVIVIRDASWSLLSAAEQIDEDLVPNALTYAAQRRNPEQHLGLLALAEACWLRAAVEHRREEDAEASAQLRVLPSAPSVPGTLADEVDFLSAVAAAWDSTAVATFLSSPPEDQSQARRRPEEARPRRRGRLSGCARAVEARWRACRDQHRQRGT